MKAGSAGLLALVTFPLLAQVGPRPDQLPPLPEELLRVLATENTLTPAPAPAPAPVADAAPLMPAPQPPPPPAEHLLPVEEAAAVVAAESLTPSVAAESSLLPESPTAPAVLESAVEPVAATDALPVPPAPVEPLVPAVASAPASSAAADAASAVAVATPATPAPVVAVDDTAVNVAAAVAIVDAFHQTLREGWKDGVLPHLAPDVVILEQGYVELSRDDYANGNLDSDLVFAASTRREVVQRKSEVRGDLAWVVTQSRITGQVGGQPVDLENAETMVLRGDEGQWRIVHIHWSAHSREPG